MKNSPIRSLTLAMSCLGLLTTSVASQANEGGLYGPTAPAGSAFVRTYNAGSSELDLSLGPVSIKDVAPQGSSDFKFLPAGSYSASAAGQSLPVTLKSDQYYTLVQLPGGKLSLVEDPAFKNRQKALVRLQNLSDTPVSLKTADGKTVNRWLSCGMLAASASSNETAYLTHKIVRSLGMLAFDNQARV